MEDKRVTGIYICWACHKQFPMYEGQRRRYCPKCALKRQRELGGTRKPNKAKED